MSSFKSKYLEKLSFNNEIVHSIRRIGRGQGRQEFFIERAPDVLEGLRHIAMIQSTKASNKLEGITIPAAALKRLMNKNEEPAAENRAEGEIAGYRNVLGSVHENFDAMLPSSNLLLQMHRDLFKFVGNERGRWKTTDNLITQTYPDGHSSVRFNPTPAWQTDTAVHELHLGFKLAKEGSFIDPLILIALYVLDFLCIHPFADGNGRMARLLTVLLLYREGYKVGRWVSIEHLYERTKESYYDTLLRSSQGWHENGHDATPWIAYFLSIVQAAYNDLEHRLGDLKDAHGMKKQLVLEAIQRLPPLFTIAQLKDETPTVGRDHIRNILQSEKQAGHLFCEGRGRYAQWRKAE